MSHGLPLKGIGTPSDSRYYTVVIFVIVFSGGTYCIDSPESCISARNFNGQTVTLSGQTMPVVIGYVCSVGGAMSMNLAKRMKSPN